MGLPLASYVLIKSTLPAKKASLVCPLAGLNLVLNLMLTVNQPV